MTPETYHMLHRRSAARHVNPTLLRAFNTQLRVIHALLMREIHTRYGRENIGFLWVIGEPILFCAGVAIVWTAIRPSHEHGLKMTAMVVTGYVPLTMWRHSSGRAVKAFEVNSTLLYHQLVTPLDIIVARAVLEIIGTILAGVLVVTGAVMLGYMEWPVDWGLVLAGLGFTCYFCFAFAILLAPLTERSEFLEKAMSITMYLSLPLTGAFIMTDWLPSRYQWILEASPLADSIEMIRQGVFGLKVVPHYSVPYMLASCTIMLMVGMYLSMHSRKYIEM
nr:ABC transporter permease [Formicincola oecophyllae]